MAVQLPGGYVSFLTPECMFCAGSSVVQVRADSLAAYEAGALIQDAFFDLTDGERELIKSGIHETCWDKMFPDEE